MKTEVRKRLIIDADPGNGVPGSDVDDALAIATALQSPQVNLLGLTTVAGNVEVEQATACAIALLEAADRGDVPVYQGAATPLVADPAEIRRSIRERETNTLVARLWAGIKRPSLQQPIGGRRAAEFLVEAVMANPREVTVVSIGPLTNLALAMRLEPRLAQNVQSIVWMGGAVRAPGTLTPVTEFNASYDPEATHVVLSSGSPLTIVPLDVTTRTCLTLEDVNRIRSVGTRLAVYLAEVVEPWVRFVMEQRRLPGCWLHDPLAVCAAIDPAIVNTEPMYVCVELAGHKTRGQTIGWDAHFPYSFKGGPPNCSVCTGVNTARFMALLLRTLGAPVSSVE